MDSPPEEQRNREDSPATKEMLHKTKLIQFLGRNTPIVLQNDNGPCPLLSICNVLLLRNNLNLSSDVADVSQEKLLSLVAERLIDSNSNVDNKDAGYVKNQQQNIADAIDLLPRLTTGIDVNLKFTRINDFEFTRECAIFDLLDIPLYHGWIVDPHDSDTSNAIGLKSYNTLMGELVALETQNPTNELKNSEEDCVDFVAATTASLGLPSPSLSRGKSFDDSSHSAPEDKTERKGDLQEEEELLKALKLSETANDVNVVNSTVENSNDSFIKKEEPENGDDKFHEQKASAAEDDSFLKKEEPENGDDKIHGKKDFTADDDLITFEAAEKDICSSSQDDNDKLHEQIEASSVKHDSKEETEKTSIDLLDKSEKVKEESVLVNDVNEPIYEGEEHIQETSTSNNENQEPMYEGEVVLAEQVEKVSSSADETKGKDGITPKQGELIRNFLKNSANQLTIYGLFCLQEELKERELCVFFRNNHFNTMFKFEGQLYLLATDQGYINQPDLAWEKLNEVNGNTVYMTSNFKEFNADNPETRSWDEQNALANTAEYIASMDNVAQENTSFNSDLQLAIALQQQEFEQQQQPQPPPPPQRNSPPPNTSASGESGLVTGQQVQPSRPKNSSSKQEPKSSKDKCIVM